MMDTQGVRSWSTEDGVVMRAVQRPDNCWFIRLPDDHIEVWSRLMELAKDDIPGTLLIQRPANQDRVAESELRRLGFTPFRKETAWRIPVATALIKPLVTTAHRLVSVTSLDADAVADLDNAIRGDMPGTGGWVGTGAELTETLNDPEFDPALYRVAQHPETGRLDGLIRVWNRSPEPRLGALGVIRPWRRTRLALYLIQDIAQTLLSRGVTHITTETDTTNRDSHVMARRQGGEIIDETIEWRSEIHG